MGNIHPRFWGWVIGAGTPLGALADFLGSAMNPNMGGGDHGANYVEAQVIEWIKQMLSYPQPASGLLVSGASMANLVGLSVARWLNIVCFRYKAGGLNVAELNQLNQELLVRLHESGIAAPSYTTLNGNYALRVANTNQRSRREDFDLLVEAVLRLGHQLEKEFVLSNGAQSRS